MIHKTSGIVLRAVKYGDTSLVVTILTELFGIQSYMVNGIRNSGKRSGAHFYQPSSILALEVYHNELKNLQRIKEARWNYLYKHVLTDIVKNAVAMYMVELLMKCLKQPEQNEDLFSYAEDAFHVLDTADEKITANFPLFFAMHLAQFFGFRVTDNYSERNSIFDLQEGNFTSVRPASAHYVEGDHAFYISQILKAIHPEELSEIKINRVMRRNILATFEVYYGLHIQDFGVMKTLPVLQEILS